MTEYGYVPGPSGRVKHRIVQVPLEPLAQQFRVDAYGDAELGPVIKRVRSGRYDRVLIIGDAVIEGHDEIAAAHRLGMTHIRAIRLPEEVIHE